MVINNHRTITALIYIVLLLLSGYGHADFDPRLIGKGFKGGINIAHVANHPGETKMRTGYMLGALANYPLINNIDFQIELLVTEKGYRVPDTAIFDSQGNRIGTAEWSALLTYVEIPVMAKFTMPIPSKVKPYLIIGGFISQAIIKKERLSTIDVVYDVDLENVKNNDAGFVLGAGVDIKTGGGRVFLESRFDYSNISILKYTKYRSRVWSFQAGYWW